MLTRSVTETLVGARRAIEDTAVSMIPQAVSLAAGIVSSVLIARGLGPARLGEYALITSISTLAALLSDLGIGGTAIRYASRRASLGDIQGHLAILRWAFRIRMTLALATSAAAFYVIPILAQHTWRAVHLVTIMRVSLLIGIFSAAASVPTIYFQTIRRFKTNALVSVAQTLLLLAGTLAVAFAHAWSLDVIVLVSVATTATMSLASLILVPRRSLFDIRELLHLIPNGLSAILAAPSPPAVPRDTLDPTTPHTFAFYAFLSTLIVQITLRADIWLMGFYLDKSQIGLYNVATKLTLPLSMLLGAISTALWPRASSLHSPTAALALLRRTLRLSLIVAATGCIYAALAPPLIPYVFGPGYSGAVAVAHVLAARYCISMIVSPLGIIGLNTGLIRVLWIVNLVQLVVVIGGNVILLPRLGVLGSAVSLLANELVGALLFGVLIVHRGRVLKGKTVLSV